MGKAMFYHLTRSGNEETARLLLGRALAQGWSIMIRSPDPAALDRLDGRLWIDPEDGFLPHGRQGGPRDAEQPVLLGTGAITNGARGLILLDGADASLDEARQLDRVWLLFSAADPDRMAHARTQWTRLTEAGIDAEYWSEDSGRCEMKREKKS